jgi:hypothetical protein
MLKKRGYQANFEKGHFSSHPNFHRSGILYGARKNLLLAEKKVEFSLLSPKTTFRICCLFQNSINRK